MQVQVQPLLWPLSQPVEAVLAAQRPALLGQCLVVALVGWLCWHWSTLGWQATDERAVQS